MEINQPKIGNIRLNIGNNRLNIGNDIFKLGMIGLDWKCHIHIENIRVRLETLDLDWTQ